MIKFARSHEAVPKVVDSHSLDIYSSISTLAMVYAPNVVILSVESYPSV